MEEQLNKLKEEELHCKAMWEQIRECMAMLQQDQAPCPEPAPAPHAAQPVRPLPRPIIIIIIEEVMCSDKEEGEYRMMQQHHWQHRGGLGTPLSVEFEELQWLPCFNPAILPQYDGDSNPREFLLKYEAAVEATGGGTACKVKALVLSLRGLAQH